MDEQRIYLDPALTIDKLADRVGVSERTLSTLINKQLGENFQNFVNGNRVHRPWLRRRIYRIQPTRNTVFWMLCTDPASTVKRRSINTLR